MEDNMKIILSEIQADGQGSFFIQDEVTGENFFHFVTQIENKVTLKETMQKYLDETNLREDTKAGLIIDVETAIAELA